MARSWNKPKPGREGAFLASISTNQSADRKAVYDAMLQVRSVVLSTEYDEQLDLEITTLLDSIKMEHALAEMRGRRSSKRAGRVLIVTGEAGAGKSHALMNAFGSRPEFVNFGVVGEVCPLLSVVAPSPFTLKALGNEIVRKIGYLGEAPEVRRLHSVRSASVETGIHHATLRKILAAASVIDPSSLPDDLVTFDAVAHSGLLNDLSSALDLGAAAGRLGVSPSTLEELLRAGLVVPLLGGTGSGFRHYRFRLADLDAFVESLASGSKSATGQTTGLRSILDAARSAAHPVAGIAKLLLGRQVANVSRDRRSTGLSSVLVDPAEIRTVLAGPPSDMAHPAEAKQATGLPLHVVRSLVRAELLEGRQMHHPRTGVLRLMLVRESLRRFRRDHVTLVELAREEGVSPILMWRRLSAAGAATAVDHRSVGAVIYLKTELARCQAGQSFRFD